MGNEFTATAFRNLQKQILQKAIEALETTPLEKRDQSALTMAMDSKLMPEVRARIKAFRREMAEFQERSKTCDQVYHLSVSFYPVMNPLTQEESQYEV